MQHNSKVSQCVLLCQLLLLATCIDTGIGSSISKEYCIVGAGPSGLQLAYFLQRSASDYVVLERSHTAGAFFSYYPRHRKLISINKRWSDSENSEYRLRHDWNSLLSDDPRLQFGRYSDIMFPHSDLLVQYMSDFQRNFNISVHFNTSVLSVTKPHSDGKFNIIASGQRTYKCSVVVMATGLPNLRKMDFPGSEYTIGYDTVSMNRSDFEGKRVMIIGKGNAAFEIAQHIYGSTRLVHMVARNPVRFAWSTHYVGDLRAVNDELLDTYQLKSLDGMFETDSLSLKKNEKGELCLTHTEDQKLHGSFTENESSGKYCYDIVIRASGFVFDNEPLSGLNITTVLKGKYPRIANQFESSDVTNLFFAGTNTHSLDFRKSAGGFIHGFRYTARALFRYLQFRRHGRKWPERRAPVGQLLDTLVKRINEGSGNYQMFSTLGDIVLLSKDKSEFTLLEEVPVKLLHMVHRITGHTAEGDILVFQFEYGRNFSGPRMDTFHESRAGCRIKNAHKCNFLHPVIYHYTQLPTKQQMFDPELSQKKLTLPKPSHVVHLMEDFFTSFRQVNHIMPLVGFLEKILKQPLVPLSDEYCQSAALLHAAVPKGCRGSGGDALSWSIAGFQS